MAPLRSLSANLASTRFLRISSWDLGLVFGLLKAKGNLSGRDLVFKKVETWFLIFVTREGLLGAFFIFFRFLKTMVSKAEELGPG